jgi:hypothetical protein
VQLLEVAREYLDREGCTAAAVAIGPVEVALAMWEAGDLECLAREAEAAKADAPNEIAALPRLAKIAAFALSEPVPPVAVPGAARPGKRTRKRAKRTAPTRNEAALPGMCDAIVLDGAGAVTELVQLQLLTL